MIIPKEKLLGIILCGGQSQRMGSDKGLLTSQQKTWAEMAFDKMRTLNIPVKISINEQQRPIYAKVFSKDKLIADVESLSIKGPLLAALSCHLTFPEENIFLLACDMPLMETSVLSSLYKIYQEQNSDVYIFTNNGEAEPMCGIYTAKGLAVIHSMLNKGELVKHSMKFMLEHLPVTTIPLRKNEKKYFRNINTLEDLND